MLLEVRNSVAENTACVLHPNGMEQKPVNSSSYHSNESLQCC